MFSLKLACFKETFLEEQAYSQNGRRKRHAVNY